MVWINLNNWITRRAVKSCGSTQHIMIMNIRIKFSLIVLLITFPLLSYAQSRSLLDVYREYEHLDESFSLNISGNFLKMASWFEDDLDEDDLDDVIHSIDKIKILKVPKGFKGMSGEEGRRFKRNLRHEDFEELMNIRGEDGVFFVLVKERRGVVDDLVMFGEGDHGVIFIEFLGHMDAKKIGRICRKIEMDEI